MHPFDPTLFYDVARELTSQPYSQARHRTAVGRAYYAVFLLAREKTRVTAVQGVHEQVITVLEAAGYPDTAEFLKELRRYRVEADYQLKPDYKAYGDWRKVWRRVAVISEAVLHDFETMPALQPRPRPKQ